MSWGTRSPQRLELPSLPRSPSNVRGPAYHFQGIGLHLPGTSGCASPYGWPFNVTGKLNTSSIFQRGPFAAIHPDRIICRVSALRPCCASFYHGSHYNTLLVNPCLDALTLSPAITQDCDVSDWAPGDRPDLPYPYPTSFSSGGGLVSGLNYNAIPCRSPASLAEVRADY